ncbi:MAG: SRPBCC family protein, partial [Pseudomonadota bacterium]
VELLSGEAGHPGAVIRVTLRHGGRTRQVIEEVTERREPDFLATRADDGNGRATTVYHFEALQDGRTRWVIYTGYVTHGLKRLVAPFMKQSIGSAIEDTLNRFKLVVESDARGSLS